MTIILTNIDFPTRPPTRKYYVLLNLKLRSQAKNLYFPAHAIIQQDLRASTAGEITNMNI